MNLVELAMNSNWTNYNSEEVFDRENKVVYHGEFDLLSMVYLENKDIEGLMRALEDYSGENYVSAVNMAILFERWDVAYNVALKHKDYELCKEIYKDKSSRIQEMLLHSLKSQYSYNEKAYGTLKTKHQMTDQEIDDFVDHIHERSSKREDDGYEFI